MTRCGHYRVNYDTIEGHNVSIKNTIGSTLCACDQLIALNMDSDYYSFNSLVEKSVANWAQVRVMAITMWRK